MDGQLHQAVSDEDLQAAVAFLEAEALLLQQYLRRTAGSAPADADAPADASPHAAPEDLPRESLLLAEKQELCVAEIAATRREAEAIRDEGELQRAAAAAAEADARGHQAAELAMSLVGLLDVLGLPQPAPEARIPAAHDMLAPPPPAAAQELAQPGDAVSADAPAAAAAATGDIIAPAARQRLPSARQLARADLHGGRVEEWMEGVLARHAAAAERLRQRTALLKVRGPGAVVVAGCTLSGEPTCTISSPSRCHCHPPTTPTKQGQLAKAEAQLAERAEAGTALKRVDFDALRIEHAQAGAALAAADADTVRLKAAVAAAQQRLGEQRAALGAAAAAADALRQQTAQREGQLAGMRAQVAKAAAEAASLERECQRKGSSGSNDGEASPSATSASATAAAPSILDYMRVKAAVAEAAQAVTDWERKLEVQAGARRAPRCGS